MLMWRCINEEIEMIRVLWEWGLLGQSQWRFHQDVMHIYYSAMSAKLHFLHETKRKEKKVVSPW